MLSGMTPQFVLQHDSDGPSCGDHPDWSIESEIENLQWAEGYAEPGYSNPECAVLFANWNKFSRRACDALERMGYALEWSDEWLVCDCGKAFRTSPNSHIWKMYGEIFDGDYSCGDCLKDDSESYLESLSESHQPLTLDSIDPSDYGYQRIHNPRAYFHPERFESGWHPGQTDSPKKIGSELEQAGIERYFFQIDSTEQFSTYWSCWVSEIDWHKVPERFQPKEESD